MPPSPYSKNCFLFWISFLLPTEKWSLSLARISLLPVNLTLELGISVTGAVLNGLSPKLFMLTCRTAVLIKLLRPKIPLTVLAALIVPLTTRFLAPAKMCVSLMLKSKRDQMEVGGTNQKARRPPTPPCVEG